MLDKRSDHLPNLILTWDNHDCHFGFIDFPERNSENVRD